MAHANKYLPLVLARALVAADLKAVVRPVRQFGKPGQRTVTWSLMIGGGFVDTIDGASPLTKNYLIEIHEPYKVGPETPMTDTRDMAIEAISNIDRLSEVIRYEIAGARGEVIYEYDEGSHASQQGGDYFSRVIAITLPAEESLPDLPEPPEPPTSPVVP